jgi:dTDP-4-amino-4,6-dideoxygalactose transaminase
MTNSKIWLSSPHMGGSEQKFVQDAFDTNWVAPLGPNVNGFEKDLEDYLGENVFAAALSSGTAALHLALIILNVKPEDEVICQSMTFSASANPIVYLGAKPVFVDSENETMNLCPIALEEAILNGIKRSKKPKAIVIVHLYGMPCKVDEIRNVANKYEIPIIEDSAEALGSTYKGKKCGTFGDIGILSFNGNKIITTSGGGAMITKTVEVKNKAVFLSTQARDNAPHYQHSEIGYNYRMSNICAGIGRGQMEVLDNHLMKRREMHQFYLNLFSEIKGITVFNEPSSDYFSNHWLSCILFDSSKTNVKSEDLRLALEKDNIESRPLWKPMHLQPVFSSYAYFGNNISEKLFNNGLCLPSSSNLTDNDRERITKVIKSLF